MQEKETLNGAAVTASAEAWYGTEPEIPESAITETIGTEILIIGAGTAGMVAAIVAGSRE